jgi:hypothetical protein
MQEDAVLYKYNDLVKHILGECSQFTYVCHLCKESIDIKEEQQIYGINEEDDT